ncbi:BCS1 [Mytilus edulis]|uniref:BCS1 n=1 Tax=Mytilus edulis TaxID=6550 RepID=A0A8S3R2K6_MYTED|nr:BCS1 [Mytilus edulis]
MPTTLSYPATFIHKITSSMVTELTTPMVTEITTPMKTELSSPMFPGSSEIVSIAKTCDEDKLDFSVSADLTATLTTGAHSYPPNGVIGYNRVINTEFSNSYSNGIYTVSRGNAGRYLVSVTMMSGLVPAWLTLRRNEAEIYVWLYTGTPWQMATQTVSMALGVSDRISVHMQSTASRLFDVYNTFTVMWIGP